MGKGFKYTIQGGESNIQLRFVYHMCELLEMRI